MLNKTKSNNYPEKRNVNVTVTWDEGKQRKDKYRYIRNVKLSGYSFYPDKKGIQLRVQFKTDEWLRRRIRIVIWKKIKTRGRNLIKLGINKFKAWEFANSPILKTSVTNDRLKQSGYIFFSDYYRKVSHVN